MIHTSLFPESRTREHPIRWEEVFDMAGLRRRDHSPLDWTMFTTHGNFNTRELIYILECVRLFINNAQQNDNGTIVFSSAPHSNPTRTFKQSII